MRELLEVRVVERTEELRKAELERMSQAYRFVEFGRLAGSVFHDLTSPLTALSLNIDSIAKGAGDRRSIAAFADDISRAQTAAAHMQKLMTSMRRHLARDGAEESFSLDRALIEALQVLGSYARARGVALSYDSTEDVERHGDPVAFLQIITNIVSNAIESFPPVDGLQAARSVTLALREELTQAVLTISDTGPGMSEEVRTRIFEPFFSTKGETGGMGIGLSLAKRILEKSFGGSLDVTSVLGKGTTFTLYFPHREP